MDTLSHFRSIEELVKMLDREKVLFRDMFERRKSLAYRKEFALEVVDYKRERIQYLIDHGVIHEYIMRFFIIIRLKTIIYFGKLFKTPNILTHFLWHIRNNAYICSKIYS